MRPRESPRNEEPGYSGTPSVPLAPPSTPTYRKPGAAPAPLHHQPIIFDVRKSESQERERGGERKRDEGGWRGREIIREKKDD